MKKQGGFSIIESLLILVVLVIVGVVGYMAYMNFLAPKAADTTTKESSEQVKVESKKDLDKADKALDDVSLEDTDSTQIDEAADNF